MHTPKRIITALLAAVLAATLAAPACAATLGLGAVTGQGVRLRSGPSTADAVLLDTAKGDTVIILGEANGWYQVDYNTTIGYMSAQFMDLIPRSEGYLGFGQVTAQDGLNLRAGPDGAWDVLTTIPAQTVLNLTGIDGGWYKTAYDGLEGYVSSDYIVRVPNPNAAQEAPQTLSGSQLGQAIVAEAMKHLGKSYVLGGSGPNSFDCCGFTQYVYKQVTGQTMPRTCDGQLYNGPGVRVDCALADCQPGDLLFRGNEPGRPGVAHVAICLGDMKIIHASTPSTGVIITDMKQNGNYQKYYMGVRRLG